MDNPAPQAGTDARANSGFLKLPDAFGTNNSPAASLVQGFSCQRTLSAVPLQPVMRCMNPYMQTFRFPSDIDQSRCVCARNNFSRIG